MFNCILLLSAFLNFIFLCWYRGTVKQKLKRLNQGTLYYTVNVFCTICIAPMRSSREYSRYEKRCKWTQKSEKELKKIIHFLDELQDKLSARISRAFRYFDILSDARNKKRFAFHYI